MTVQPERRTTIEYMAETLACEPARIAKMIPVLLCDGLGLIITSGDTRINRTKFKDVFHQKLTEISPDQLRELTGYTSVNLLPFATETDIQIYLDISIKRFGYVHVANSTFNASVQLSTGELVQYIKAIGWVDICRGWLANGNCCMAPAFQ